MRHFFFFQNEALSKIQITIFFSITLTINGEEKIILQKRFFYTLTKHLWLNHKTKYFSDCLKWKYWNLRCGWDLQLNQQKKQQQKDRRIQCFVCINFFFDSIIFYIKFYSFFYSIIFYKILFIYLFYVYLPIFDEL